MVEMVSSHKQMLLALHLVLLIEIKKTGYELFDFFVGEFLLTIGSQVEAEEKYLGQLFLEGFDGQQTSQSLPALCLSQRGADEFKVFLEVGAV